MKSSRKSAMASIRAELAKRNSAAGLIIESNAKRLAPVDTGRLRASITHDSDEDGVIVGTNVEYAVFQELGTRYQSGKPFLVPGLRNSIPALQKLYGAEVK